MNQRLGQVQMREGWNAPFMGKRSEPVYYCVETQAKGAQIKKEFRIRDGKCSNTWTSPPGIYPGIEECRPDGKPSECPFDPRFINQEMAGAFLGAAKLQPSYELGRPVPRRRLGQLSCCNAPNGYGYCFDTGSGECIATWVSASGAPGGSPACAVNAQGQITHPSCAGLEPGPPSTRPELPPGCTYVAAEGNAMQDVICECYNCTTKKSDGWRGPLGEFVSGGSKNPCLRSPEWFPKPAVCPAGPGGGGAYTPPAATPTPTGPAAPSVAPTLTPAAQTAAGIPVSNIVEEAIQQAEQAISPESAFQADGQITPPPTVEDQPYYEAGPPVLPPPQNYTSPAMPTGAFPGAPFPAMPPAAPPMKAIAPAPRPEACPLGPVAIAKWANQCALSKLNE